MNGTLRRAIATTLGALVVLITSTEADTLRTLSLSPRSLGAGGAYLSIAEDLSAFFANPAGLSRHAENRNVFVHSHLMDQSQNWSISAGLIDGRTEDPLHWGFAFNTVHTKNIELEDYVLSSSYSFQNFVLLGVSHRLINFNPADLTRDYWAFSMTAGLLAFPFDVFAVGLSIQDFYSTSNDRTFVPFRYGAGVSLNLKLLRLAVDLDRNHSAGGTFLRTGVEARPIQTVVVRAGYYTDRDRYDYGYSLGFSVEPFPQWHLDFGYLDRLKSPEQVLSGGMGIQFY